MAKFSWNRSNSATLSNLVRNFNRIVNSLGEQFVRFEYASLKAMIKTKRDFNMWTNRLRKIKEPKEQEIITTKQGVEMTRWEKNVLQQLNRRANSNRKKLQKSIQEERAIGFLPTDEELRYAPHGVNPENYMSRKTFNRVFEGELRYSSAEIIDAKNNILRQNLISTLDKWPTNIPWLDKLRELYLTADARDLRLLQADPHYNVELAANYITLYTHQDEELYSEAEGLYYRWLNALQQVEENRAVVEGRK